MTISEIGFLKSGIFVADKIGYMELDQYNFKQFQDGLTDILKNPWKEPVFIQDAIPTFPIEDKDEDRRKHNLLKTFFIYNRLIIPFYYAIWYLCLNKVYYLKYVLEINSTKKDFIVMFKSTSRLTSHEIYEAFNGMSSNNASFLLDRIDCPVSIYTKLKDALESGEETKFVEAIDECNLSNILPALKHILFIKKQVKQLDSTDSQGDEETYLGFEAEKPKMLYAIETEITEKYGILPNSHLKQESMAFFDELLSLTNNPNKLLESFYPLLFYQYCQMKEGGGLNDSDVKAFEYIFHQPAFEEQYYENLKLWKDGILKDMFTKQPKEDSLSKIAENEELQTPQIEEPAAEGTKETPERPQNTLCQGSGRHKGSWIKDRGQIKEEQIGTLIRKNIWDSLVESVGKLKFNKGIEGKTKEKQVKNFSAGLLYYVLESIGWAKVYTTSGVQSSFERTMRFAGIARTSFEKNIRYIHEWFNLADEYKGHPNQFDVCYSTCKEKDPNMASLIFNNVNEIGGIIERFKVKLKKTLDENCKL